MNRFPHIALFIALAAASLHVSRAAEAGSPALPPQIVPVHPIPLQPPASTIDSYLKWDSEAKETVVPHGVVEGNFSFWLTNVSSTDVVINAVNTSCGCTAAKLPAQPWVIRPGTNGEIQVTMNVANKMGMVTKTVTVHTDRGSKMLFVKSNILPPSADEMTVGDRENNQKIALADRQSVFRGDCARCHADSKDKMGKELFTSVCGVCHEAEHRASMVPNLHALTQPTNAEYWRNWVTKGKVGTLMPAFSEKEGGILTEAQIESLVKYLGEFIPSRSAAVPAASNSASAPTAQRL